MELALGDLLTHQFALETASTRRVLAQVPWDQRAWRPHPKSMPMGDLATHTARLAGNPAMILASDRRDIVSNPYSAITANSTSELLEAFDRLRQDSLTALTAARPEDLAETWTLLRNGEIVVALPRAAAIATISLHHMIHHRAQLGVYLRLNDLPVPAVYGPSADER